MANFQQKVESYTGSISDTTALSEWLTTAARFVTDLLPDHVLDEYATTVDVSTDGLALATYRYLKALKNGYEVRMVGAGMSASVQDSNSIHYAIASSPVGLRYNGKLYIYPDGGEALAMQYPSVLYNASTITNFPSRMLHGVVLYAAIQALLSKASTAIGSAASISVPTAPSAPSFSFTDVTGQTVTLPSSPAYTKPTTTFSNTNLSSYINSSATEDLEQATAEANHQKTLLEKFQMDLYNELNEVNAEIEAYRGSLQKYIEDARMAQEAGLLNSTKDLEASIHEYGSQLSKYQSELQSYASQIGGNIDSAQGYLVLMDKIKVEFNDFINGVIGSNG